MRVTDKILVVSGPSAGRTPSTYCIEAPLLSPDSYGLDE